MAKRLKTYVHLSDETGEVHSYGPQDDVPREHAKLIGDHAWVDDEDADPAPTDRPGIVIENAPEDAQPGAARPKSSTSKAKASGGRARSASGSRGRAQSPGGSPRNSPAGAGESSSESDGAGAGADAGESGS